MADEAQGPTINIGDAIKKSIAESMKNIDPVAIMQKIVASTPEEEESDEVRQKLQGVLQKYNDMNEDDREQFVSQMKEILANRITMKMKDFNPNLDGLQEEIGQAIMYRLALLGVGALLLVILFVFFGYKLYKSIKEKEVRREEKKKAKQMKKKK
ncbi:uncharacterized protein LOC126378538 [Pectinophora gossypiella]|uniref:Uncharacterized protein n=1 Tax=Pectinophora gossypiella TaxID=13191 RepID=A0A1E1W3T9_PECGO|nr:uncharacterized protein LOC126378538 [Pectinophora gossypiella]XP_049882929.1 uncharacterized protein LOC126378538 [Pectinophora gossypiella]XP_049882930.1 uncharacterized protein LOC126378538 [Pectinophora gossypiella]